MKSPDLQGNIFFTILCFAVMVVIDTVEARRQFCTGSTVDESEAVRNLLLLFSFSKRNWNVITFFPYLNISDRDQTTFLVVRTVSSLPYQGNYFPSSLGSETFLKAFEIQSF